MEGVSIVACRRSVLELPTRQHYFRLMILVHRMYRLT
jgi:hypothetical protein